MCGNIKTKKQIEEILLTNFGLKASVQVFSPKGEERTLYQLEYIPFHRRMSIGGLERLCRRIAKALDADLLGSVNIDFVSLGEPHTFDLLLEVSHEHRQTMETTMPKSVYTKPKFAVGDKITWFCDSCGKVHRGKIDFAVSGYALDCPHYEVLGECCGEEKRMYVDEYDVIDERDVR